VIAVRVTDGLQVDDEPGILPTMFILRDTDPHATPVGVDVTGPESRADWRS